MPRLLTTLLLALLLAPAGAAAAASPLADPGPVLDALADATPPADLPGNDDAAIELATWEATYGEPLEGTEGAWVLTGSTQLPIASILVFESPGNADDGLGDYRVESSSIEIDGMTAYLVANRINWICVAVDGAVMIVGQAEPASDDEGTDAVRARSCDAMLATHAWLVTSVTGAPASPEATPAPDAP
jgi:hypothetical protein